MVNKPRSGSDKNGAKQIKRLAINRKIRKLTKSKNLNKI